MSGKRRSGTHRWSTARARGKFAPGRALAVLIGLELGFGLAIGCATPEEKYRTLSIFFDDVPLPESMRPAPVAPEVEIAVEPVLPKRPVVEWVVHEPSCDECHTSRETQLAYADPPELCWDCHDSEDFAGSFLHGPFAAGACLQCHTPHKSQYASLLRRLPAELCEGCHDGTTFAALAQHRAEEGEDCLQCHNPHSAPGNHLLNERPSRASHLAPASEWAAAP